jgi:hypothetical protein
MAGSLVKIDEEIISGSVSSVAVGGANWDSSYDVYKVVVNALKVDTNDVVSYFRVLDNSNNPVTSANYDWARKILKANASFGNGTLANSTLDYFANNRLGTGGNETASAVLYLFNFNNASEYSFYTTEQLNREKDGNLQGIQGGGVLTVAEAHTGLTFFPASGNFDSGTFTLYGLKK